VVNCEDDLRASTHLLLRRQHGQRHARRYVARGGTARRARVPPMHYVDKPTSIAAQAEARLPPEHDGRLVFSFGANDCCPGEDIGGVRVAPGRALTNAEAILTAAVAWRPTLMVGSLPICDIAVDRRIRHLSDDFASLCARLRVPYLDVFDLVAASDIWAREIAAGDGVHPNEGGYAVIGDAVENWAGWRAWIDRAASS